MFTDVFFGRPQLPQTEGKKKHVIRHFEIFFQGYLPSAFAFFFLYPNNLDQSLNEQTVECGIIYTCYS
jgi:hypothetical protein